MEAPVSIGSSGRIVIEIPPETKRELYAVLSSNGQTLKEWFLRCAHEYVRTGRQLAIFQDALGSEGSDTEVRR
jgi:hypothetical protein